MSLIYYYNHSHYFIYDMLLLHTRFFLSLVLDKVLCPVLVKYFDMPIWHPTCEKTLDTLLDTKVDVEVSLSLFVAMSLPPCIFSYRYSSKGTVAKSISLFNQKLVHVINDVIWNLGFKAETQA